MPESIYGLEVLVSISDRMSAPLKGIAKSLEYAGAQAKLMQQAMRAAGAGSTELSALQKQMNALAKADTFKKLSQDMKAAGASSAQLQMVSDGLNKVSEAHERMQKAQKVTMVGAGITAAGGGLLYGLGKMAEQAAKFQESITGAIAAMKLTPQQQTQFTNMAMTLGIPTRFSAQETAGIMNSMYTAGLTKQQVLNSNLASAYIRFADVQAYRKSEDPQTAVTDAVGMTHMFGLYSSQQLTPFLNQLNAVLMNTHDSISQFATTFKYVAAQSKLMGMSPQDSLAAVAWLGRMGMGSGRGGTNLADFMRLSIYGAGSAAASAAMKQAGLVANGHSVFTNSTGQFVGIPQAVQIMQDLKNRYHGNMNVLDPVISKIWGVQGGRVAQLLMSGGAATQYQMVQKEMATSGTTAQIQHAYATQPSGEYRQAVTTLQDIMLQFGLKLLPIFNKLLTGINPFLSAALKFEQTHPQIMKVVAGVTLLTAGLLVLGGILTTVAGTIGMMAASWAGGGIARTGLSMIGKVAASPVTLPMKLYDKVAPSIGRGAWYAGQSVKNGAMDLGTASLNGIKSAGSAIESTTKSLASMASQATVVGVKMAAFAVRTGAVKVAQMAATAASKLFRLAMIGVDLVLDANPVALLVLAIASLVAGIIVMITHWKQTIEIVKEVWSWMKQLGTWIGSAFMGIVHQAADWGKNIVLGLWNGLKSMGGWLASHVTSWIDDVIPGPIRKALQIHSPSRLMMQIGAYTAQGLALGITNSAHLVSHASNQLASNAIPTSVMSGGSAGSIGTQHIEININGYNKDKRELARFILDVVGKDARRSNMSTGIYPNKLAP